MTRGIAGSQVTLCGEWLPPYLSDEEDLPDISGTPTSPQVSWAEAAWHSGYDRQRDNSHNTTDHHHPYTHGKTQCARRPLLPPPPLSLVVHFPPGWPENKFRFTHHTTTLTLLLSSWLSGQNILKGRKCSVRKVMGSKLWVWVWVVSWHLVRVGTFSVMYDHTFLHCKSPDQTSGHT